MGSVTERLPTDWIIQEKDTSVRARGKNKDGTVLTPKHYRWTDSSSGLVGCSGWLSQLWWRWGADDRARVKEFSVSGISVVLNHSWRKNAIAMGVLSWHGKNWMGANGEMNESWCFERWLTAVGQIIGGGGVSSFMNKMSAFEKWNGLGLFWQVPSFEWLDWRFDRETRRQTCSEDERSTRHEGQVKSTTPTFDVFASKR